MPLTELLTLEEKSELTLEPELSAILISGHKMSLRCVWGSRIVELWKAGIKLIARFAGESETQRKLAKLQSATPRYVFRLTLFHPR